MSKKQNNHENQLIQEIEAEKQNLLENAIIKNSIWFFHNGNRIGLIHYTLDQRDYYRIGATLHQDDKNSIMEVLTTGDVITSNELKNRLLGIPICQLCRRSAIQ